MSSAEGSASAQSAKARSSQSVSTAPDAKSGWSRTSSRNAALVLTPSSGDFLRPAISDNLAASREAPVAINLAIIGS